MTSHSENPHPEKTAAHFWRDALPDDIADLTPEHLALMANHAMEWTSDLQSILFPLAMSGLAGEDTVVVLHIPALMLIQLSQDIAALVHTHDWLEKSPDSLTVWPKGPITFDVIDRG